MTVAELVAGSHGVTFDARVLTTFQTGDDPDGVEVDVLGGELAIDGTAEIRGAGELTTSGVDGQDGESLFPRGPSPLFGPYGNEVFVRRGIDLGTSISWHPLGYYRISVTEQFGGAYDPMTVTLADRMATLIESELLRPRAFSLGTSVSTIFDDLVLDVYPDATIQFDDNSGSSTLGRLLIAEKSRYKTLYDIATSLGKVMYWNPSGVLRIEDSPDEDEIAWDVRAGVDGKLIDSNRRVTRETIRNAWRVTGDGMDTTNPVIGIAVDANPDSPTYFFDPPDGRQPFGKVPRRFSSPFITTTSQAEGAAVAGLKRTLGAPYSLAFVTVPDTDLAPGQAGRLTHEDGNRDVHVIQDLTIPLSEDGQMIVNTRDKIVPLVVTQ